MKIAAGVTKSPSLLGHLSVAPEQKSVRKGWISLELNWAASLIRPAPSAAHLGFTCAPVSCSVQPHPALHRAACRACTHVHSRLVHQHWPARFGQRVGCRQAKPLRLQQSGLEEPPHLDRAGLLVFNFIFLPLRLCKNIFGTKKIAKSILLPPVETAIADSSARKKLKSCTIRLLYGYNRL